MGEAVNSFARGETAMVIGFANHVSKIAHSDIGTLIGFSTVPGNKPLLGGGVVGITKESNKKEEAISFINWINDTVTAEQITLLGGTSPNQKVYQNQTIRMLYPWLEGLNKANIDGIRDTKNKNGKRLNTRSIEQIIGKSIKEILINQVDIEEGIKQLNKRLACSSGSLMKI
ncbi:extracellular solute-binding protein [Bacillus sp. N9]